MTKTSSPTKVSLLDRLTQHQPALLMQLQGWRRRILFVVSFEVLAISCSSFGLSQMSDQSIAHASIMGAACSAIAVSWNWLFNSLFEKSLQTNVSQVDIENVSISYLHLEKWWVEVNNKGFSDVGRYIISILGFNSIFLVPSLIIRYNFNRLYSKFLRKY